MRRSIVLLLSLMLPLVNASGASAQSPGQQKQVDQGSQWTRDTRGQFYSQDQGSRLIPLQWMMALKQPDGAPFMADTLSRYGYLKNDETASAGLPVGFTTNTDNKGTVHLGMNCAACHTRQIEVGGISYRLDGGPAIADFQSFLTDLHRAVQTVLTDAAAFQTFAAAVLGGAPDQQQALQLRGAVMVWFTPFDTIIRGSLPTPAWGPSRLDAVAMIFNRLSGLDIGDPGAGYMIPKNIQVADAPARYPFIWNASVQNRTQWPGFAPNGDDLLAMVRNTGEVLGVFGHFHPTKDALGLPHYEDNSVNIDGLLALETLIGKIGRPAFQWPVDAALAKRGEAVFNWSIEQGSGCESCHGKHITARGLGRATWDTPVQDVGTDTREWDTLGRMVDTGVLKNTGIPTLKARDSSVSLLASSVVGIILPHIGKIATYDLDHTMDRGDKDTLEARIARIPEQLAAVKWTPSAKGARNMYESRVMEGIWAAAPYLHNGSVPTLADLLLPATQRPTAFKIGPQYDPTGKVGLAAEQTKFDYTLHAVCLPKSDPNYQTALNSGYSNCGHEFGVNLKDEDKRALLEYLKTL